MPLIQNAMGLPIWVPDAQVSQAESDAKGATLDAMGKALTDQGVTNGIVRTGTTGSTPTSTAAATTTAAPTKSWEQLEAERLEKLRRKNMAAILGALMADYGLGALAGRIDGWIIEGYDSQAIEALIRTTPEYASRFPAMKELQAQGRSMTESDYIAYEQSMVEYESMFGLPKGMLSSSDMVRRLLVSGKSALEVQENATRAAASMYSLPQEFRDTMRRYYGIDSGGLTAYFLDPAVATPLLEKQYVSAQIGMEAWKQQVDVNASIAEELYKQGVTRDAARVGFGKVASQTGFTGGAGETVDQQTLIDANLTNNADAQKTVQRIASSRTARFEGGGGYVGSREGLTGIGASST